MCMQWEAAHEAYHEANAASIAALKANVAAQDVNPADVAAGQVALMIEADVVLTTYHVLSAEVWR